MATSIRTRKHFSGRAFSSLVRCYVFLRRCYWTVVSVYVLNRAQQILKEPLPKGLSGFVFRLFLEFTESNFFVNKPSSRGLTLPFVWGNSNLLRSRIEGVHAR